MLRARAVGCRQEAAEPRHDCSVPDAARHNGVYFERDQPARSSEQTYDRALRAALWEKTEALLSAVQ